MEKLYKSVKYELKPEGYFTIRLPDGGWTKFFGTETDCKTFIRFLIK